MHVIDLEGNEYALQATSTNEGETNGNQSFSAMILPTKVNKLFINKIDKLWTVVDHDDVEHKIIYLRKKGEGKSLTVQVKGIPLFFDVLDNDRIYERYDEHMTAQLAFTRIFEDTGFTFVLGGTFAAVEWEGFGDGETKLETFQRALNRYKCEFRIVDKTVYLETLIGNDTNHQYRHRLNASNIVQEIDASEMWTYAKGYGDYGDGEGGEDWQNAKLIREYTSPLVAILGIRHAPPIKNGNITTDSEMDSQLKALVDESLKLSVIATIHDLRKQNYPIAQSELGDRVFLTDERIGLDDEVRIVYRSITRNWKGDVLDVNYTFGTQGIVKRHQSKLNTAIKDIASLLEGKIQLPYSVLDDAVKNATKALQDAQTQLIFSDNGILAVDKNNPNLVTLFNSAGIGISNDGGTTFKNSITGNGVIAETIIGNSLIGLSITSPNEDGYFHVNGSDAEFVNVTNGRKVEIGPDGLYGRNASGSIRFQADASLVTSAAFGTSNDNTYLVANNETRSVSYTSIPGDGNVDSYSYLPHRSLIFRFPRIPNGYFTLLDGGEFRFTGEDTTTTGRVYQPIRCGKVFTNNVEVNTGDILYLRSDNRIRAQRKGISETYVPFQGSDFIQSSSKNLKKNIQKFNDCATDILYDLNIVKFDYKNGEKDRVGVIAEDSESISDGESVSLGDTVFLLVKTIQELTDRIEILEK